MPFINVKVIEGVFDAEQKQDIIAKLTDTMVGIEGEALRGVTWVTVEEVRSGSWCGNCATRIDLPMPASPETSTARPSPIAALATASDKAASSASRSRICAVTQGLSHRRASVRSQFGRTVNQPATHRYAATVPAGDLGRPCTRSR